MISRFVLIAPLLSDRAPTAAVRRQQPVGFGWTVAARGVDGETVALFGSPSVHERLDDAPARLDTIGARIENGVADHAVVDQGFIAGRWCNIEVVFVLECHADAADRDR